MIAENCMSRSFAARQSGASGMGSTYVCGRVAAAGTTHAYISYWGAAEYRQVAAQGC
jgi:hypothetical protein